MKGASVYEISNFWRSHGPQLTVIVEGIPANLEIKVEDINKEMFSVIVVMVVAENVLQIER